MVMKGVDAVFMIFQAPGEFITPKSQFTMVGLTVMLCNCRFQPGPALSLGLPPTDYLLTRRQTFVCFVSPPSAFLPWITIVS